MVITISTPASCQDKSTWIPGKRANTIELCHQKRMSGGVDSHAARCSVSQVDPSIFDLSPAEKLQLVEDLWDDIAANSDQIPFHDWQLEEAQRRSRNLKENPASGVSWPDLKQRVRQKYGR